MLRNVNAKNSNSILLVPNLLSLLRIGLTPVICAGVLFNTTTSRYIAFFCFMFACFTDYLDGYIARERQQISKIGMVLDPCADKVLTTAISCTLMYEKLCSLGVFLCLLMMILRDIIITALRSLTQGNPIKTTILAKIKTTLYMISLGLIIIPTAPLSGLVYWTVYVSCALSLMTGTIYLSTIFKKIS